MTIFTRRQILAAGLGFALAAALGLNTKEASAQMAVYDCEVTGITKNPDGSVDLNFIQRLDGVELGTSGFQYGSMEVFVQELQRLTQSLLEGVDVIPKIIALRAYNIDPTFGNLTPILGKKLTVNPNSVQVIRFQ